MAVGGGMKTFFWHHRWATKQPLIELVTSEPPLHLQDLTVREGWKSIWSVLVPQRIRLFLWLVAY